MFSHHHSILHVWANRSYPDMGMGPCTPSWNFVLCPVTSHLQGANCTGRLDSPFRWPSNSASLPAASDVSS